MPQLGETVVEGTITRWLKREGEAVGMDEPLVEVSTDKVDSEIPSPVAGTVARIHAGEGETVTVGSVIAEIAGAGEASDAAAPAPPKPAAKEMPAAERTPEEPPQEAPTARAPPAGGGPPPPPAAPPGGAAAGGGAAPPPGGPRRSEPGPRPGSGRADARRAVTPRAQACRRARSRPRDRAR